MYCSITTVPVAFYWAL